MSTCSKTSTFEVPKFSQNFFSPSVPLGSACGALGPSGRGSRGKTPLHYAAENGHVSALERLIEAKAAVDVQDNRGRGLGRRILGRKTSLRQWDLYVKKWMKG